MRGIRLEIWLATTAIVLVAGGSSLPSLAVPISEADISAAVPMPEPANLPPPSIDDLARPMMGSSTAPAPAPSRRPESTSRRPESTAAVPDSAAAPETAPPAAAAGPAATPAIVEAPAAAEPAVLTADQRAGEKIRDLLAGKVDRILDRRFKASVETFYSSRSYLPIWSENGAEAPRAKAARAFLAAADADGLDPADYAVPSFANADPSALAEAELRMTAAVLSYARHAQLGRVHYSRVSADISYEQTAPEPSAVLAQMADAGNIGDALDSYNPPQPGYKALKAKLAELRGFPGGNGQKRIAAGPALKIGMDDPRVPALRGRLGLPGEADETIYDKALADAVKKFQRQRDLPQTGILSNATVDMLNGGRHDRDVDLVVTNMERWRWIPRDLGKAYVMVNLPDYTLKVVDRGNVVWTTRIVIGKPGEKATPLLSETMKYITVNPTWNVPPSIVNNEYLPALAQDPQALERIGLKMERNRDGSVHIFQPPGEGNALGRIRFNFPNKFLVYQHDTPDKYMFALNQRAFSHGCMRIQNPDKYAEVLLNITNPRDGYSAERIRRMYGTGERDIPLTTPIPVHLTYQTAFVDDAGRLETREDVYGRDNRLMAALKNDDRRVADIPVEHREASAAPKRQAAATPPRMPEQRPPAGFYLFGLFR